MTATFLGPVAACQIHTERMVDGGCYHDELITPVDELWLSEDGVIGVRGDESLLHAHHRLHPNKYRAERPRTFVPERLLSLGFSGHHRMICERFGSVPFGISAEDVIVECDRKVELAELEHGVDVRTDAGTIRLHGGAVARPCVPFTKFLLGDPDAEPEIVAPNRAFLEEGVRGFVFGLAGTTEQVRIVAGDEVWAVGP